MIDTKTILTNFLKKILLNENNSLFFKKINNVKELNHEDIVVAIGIIIKPISLKK